MEEKYRLYLIKLGLKGAPKNYPQAINIISQHYSSHTGKYTDIYKITDISILRGIVKDYEQSGRFSEFGYGHHGRYRAAIKKYLEFIEFSNIDLEEVNPPLIENEEDAIGTVNLIESVFTYERDLQNSLISDINSLFPDYQIFGSNNEGVEFSIKGKRIDVLLIHNESKDLLAIELKSGSADFKVFGQISMYLGLLKNKFPNKEIRGVIIAGDIDESLVFACKTTDRISLMTYKMKLELSRYF